ncbi:MAG TPA: carbon-nitrogen hydrolase family protein [Nitrolancea sp.]|nr:carbon-nitrogen hydrolase family protein [Nitrolancea sp.]
MTYRSPSPKATLRVALAQLASEIGDVEANLAKAQDYIARAAADGADVIAFPEMYLTNYTAQVESRDLAEPLDGPALQALASSANAHDIHVVMGMPVVDYAIPGFIHNSAVVVSPSSGVVGAHHKISLPTFRIGDLLITEGNHWSPGTQFPLFNIRGWSVGINICADCWVPEIPRVQAVNGAHLLITISAGPSIWREGWPIVLRTRAIENATFQCYANVVGTHRGVDFFGGNMAISPDGDIVSQGPIDEEALIVADLPFAALHSSRAQHPRLRPGYDRHPALYGDLTRTVIPAHQRAIEESQQEQQRETARNERIHVNMSND